MAVSPRQIEFEKCVRRLREKLHGKVLSVNEAQNLMSEYDNDYEWVARTIVLVSEQNPDNLEEEQDNNGNDGAAQDVASSSTDEDEEGNENENDEKNEQSSNEGDQGEENEHEDEEENARRNIELSEEDEAGDDAIQGIAERLRQLPLTAKNLRLHNEAKRHQIPCRPRLFACPKCKRSWWRKVPLRKEVSRCRVCKVTYDAVPVHLTWGIARFICNNCNNTFRAYGQMGLPSSCFECHSQVVPTEIIPPQSRAANAYQQPRMVAMQQQRRMFVMRPERDHSCFAEDCYNRREPHIVGLHCIHPMTRRVRGLDIPLAYSREHESTNSTIATCISQDDLLEDEDDIIQEDLERIEEED